MKTELVTVYKTTVRHVPERCNISSHRRENLIFHIITSTVFLCHIENVIKLLALMSEVKVVPILNKAPCHEDLWASGVTAPIDGGEWSVSRPPAPLLPWHRAPGIHWIGSWVGPRASPDAVAKTLLFLPGIETRFVGYKARSLVARATGLPWIYILWHLPFFYTMSRFWEKLDSTSASWKVGVTLGQYVKK
jgi:hypothetical protein